MQQKGEQRNKGGSCRWPCGHGGEWADQDRERDAGQTKEPAEPVKHALCFQIPPPVCMVRFFGQQPRAETLGAALEDAEFLVPVRVGELNKLCSKRQTCRTRRIHHARRMWHTRTRRHNASSQVVHHSLSYLASTPTLYSLTHMRVPDVRLRGGVWQTLRLGHGRIAAGGRFPNTAQTGPASPRPSGRAHGAAGDGVWAQRHKTDA